MILDILNNSVYTFGPSSNLIYNGIDVSEYQGDINFNNVKSSGVDMVYIKSTEGNSYVDPYLNQNVEKAKAAGMYIGFYHYLTANNVDEALKQAKFFIDTINEYDFNLKPVMDFEYFGNLSNEMINEIAISFMKYLEESTYTPMIYSDSSNAQNIFSEKLSKYPIWVAEYGVSKPKENGKWSTWAGFQYTDTGKIEGIKRLCR